jgi:hypothetical protein
MREWNLKAGDPLSLTLAADANLGTTDYCNDQIWELRLASGEPPAVSLQTTFGLRARLLRLFPRFCEASQSISDPAAFASPPVLRKIYPNYAQITFAPFPGLQATAEYWIPDSHMASGRLKIVNSGATLRKFQFEWIAALSPNGENSQRMTATELGAGTVLAGKTENLCPVVFLTGGPQAGPGPFSSLIVNVDLEPGASQAFTWAVASLSDHAISFEAARQIASRNFDGEVARIELQNAGQVEIITGNKEWDAALALSQKVALGLFQSATDALPYPSFVISRQPDQGYSLRGNGRDYNHLWNGQAVLDTYYLIGLLLPSHAHLAQDLIRNYLSTQSEDGFIDAKPGLAGQRSQLLAMPLLATLTWQIYQSCEDQPFLEETYPGLLSFFRCWFQEKQDRDQDGIPEWSHPTQTGYEDQPIFAYWLQWSQGVDITTTETPALCALLYNEANSLIRIARQIDQKEAIPELQEKAENLRIAVEVSWDSKQATYRYWDRDSHFTASSMKLGERKGSGNIAIHNTFEHPVRLVARIHTKGDATRHPQIFIHGTNTNSQHLVERVLDDRFQWFLGLGSATSGRVYGSVERVEFHGLDPEDSVSLETIGLDYLDQTLLLPLWAGIPTAKRAKEFIKKTILNPKKFWKPFGIPACPSTPANPEDAACQQISLPWNALITEGLLHYGYRSEAAELMNRWMKAILPNLKGDAAFRKTFQAENGQPGGERNSLEGLPSLGLFLDILGVRVISNQSVYLSGHNPFPWPVTVKYRGLTILRHKEKTSIIFPGGQTASITKQEPCTVSLV